MAKFWDEKKSGIILKKSRINQEMVNTKFLPRVLFWIKRDFFWEASDSVYGPTKGRINGILL